MAHPPHRPPRIALSALSQTRRFFRHAESRLAQKEVRPVRQGMFFSASEGLRIVLEKHHEAAAISPSTTRQAATSW